MFDPSVHMHPAANEALVALAALCAVFAVKHLAADFLLQTNGMARGKERPTGWLLPLSAHVACHAALTLLILLAVAPRLWWLSLVDVVVHLGVDRGKTLVAHRGAWRSDQPQFWWLLGFDQCLHQLTNVGLALAIMLL